MSEPELQGPKAAVEGGTPDFDGEAVSRGRAIAKRTFWGLMVAATLLVVVGLLLDRMVVVGVLLVGFSFPLLKVLREYRRPDEFAKPRYWSVVSRVLDRHAGSAQIPVPAEESVAERRLRLRHEMDHIRRLGPTSRTRRDARAWTSVLLTLMAVAAGVLYLTLAHNTAAGVTWLCVAMLVAGLGWVGKVMRAKQERALSLLEEEMQQLGGATEPSVAHPEDDGNERRRESRGGAGSRGRGI